MEKSRLEADKSRLVTFALLNWHVDSRSDHIWLVEATTDRFGFILIVLVWISVSYSQGTVIVILLLYWPKPTCPALWRPCGHHYVSWFPFYVKQFVWHVVLTTDRLGFVLFSYYSRKVVKSYSFGLTQLRSHVLAGLCTFEMKWHHLIVFVWMKGTLYSPSPAICDQQEVSSLCTFEMQKHHFDRFGLNLGIMVAAAWLLVKPKWPTPCELIIFCIVWFIY